MRGCGRVIVPALMLSGPEAAVSIMSGIGT